MARPPNHRDDVHDVPTLLDYPVPTGVAERGLGAPVRMATRTEPTPDGREHVLYPARYA